jgi:GAF domain-containing protein
MTEPSSGDSSHVRDPQLALRELARIQLGDQPLTTTLQRIAELTQQAVPGVHDASVTLVEGDKVKTVVFTGPLAVDLDERQYEVGFGPCLDAATTGQTVVVGLDDADSPYPEFIEVARRAGIAHTISVGLPLPQRSVGGLNIYGTNREPFGPDARDLFETFASYAAVAVANAALYNSTADLARQMQVAVRSRAVIDQAKGIVMAKQHCSADDAFGVLVRRSQAHNVKLRDVAQGIVDSVQQG